MGAPIEIPPFDPLFRNGHLATLVGNFWSRPISESRWPVRDTHYEPEPGVQVLVREQTPEQARADLILVHGLEGTSESGYMRSMAHAALSAGFATHRYNMRGCGGSPWSLKANYHSGQTEDLLFIAKHLRRTNLRPLYIVGFSLGGNMLLKLLGQLASSDLIAGAISVCAPIDLAAAVRRITQKQNVIYHRRFVKRLKLRVVRRNPQAPDLFPLEHLPKVRSIYDFDEWYTAKIFGFGTADRYYATQSSNQFLGAIRTPVLMIHALDDPLIPPAIYRHPAVSQNPFIQHAPVEHGGHLGFLSRRKPRFWLDDLVVNWLTSQVNHATGNESATVNVS